MTTLTVTEKKAAAALVHYNLKPEINFIVDSAKPNPSRDSFGIEKHGGARLSNKTSPVKSESVDTKVDAGVSSQTKASPKGFRKILDEIIPFQIHLRLRDEPSHCPASKVGNPHTTCSCKVKRSSDNVDQIFEAISKYNKKREHTALLAQIDKLVRAVMCHRHQNVALTGPKSKPRMEILRAVILHPSQASKDDLSEFRTWINLISKRDVLVDAQEATGHDLQTASKTTTCRSRLEGKAMTSGSRTETLPPSTIDPPTAVVTPESSNPRRFQPYQSKKTKGLSVSEALLSAITDPLSESDKKNGFIYIFWDVANFGFLKIGRTINLKLRLRDWDRQCKRKHKYLTSESGEFSEIPHVSRIERLIQLELKECRKQRKCDACGKTHIEWFEVSLPHAVKVLQKWHTWIMQKPYELDSKSGEWRIRPEMQHTIQQVCEPVIQEPLPKPTPKKTQRRKSQTRRRSARFTI